MKPDQAIPRKAISKYFDSNVSPFKEKIKGGHVSGPAASSGDVRPYTHKNVCNSSLIQILSEEFGYRENVVHRFLLNVLGWGSSLDLGLGGEMQRWGPQQDPEGAEAWLTAQKSRVS